MPRSLCISTTTHKLTILTVSAALALSSAGFGSEQEGVGPPLSKVVNLHQKAVGLTQVLDELGERTGLRLTAVQHLADKRMSAFVSARPTNEVLSAIAELWSLPDYPVKWRKVRGEERRLELWQDPRAKLELERLLQADRTRIGKGLAEALQFADQADAPENAVTDDAVLRGILHGPNWRHGGRARMRLMRDLPSQAQRSIEGGETVWMPFSTLSKDTQSALVDGFVGTRYSDDQSARNALGGAMIGIGLRLETDTENPRWETAIYTQRFGSNNTEFYGLAIAPLGVSESLHLPGAESTLDSQVAKSFLSALRTAQMREWCDFEELVAQKCRLPLVSDYHHDKLPPPPSILDASSLEDLLNRATQARGHRWSAKDGFARFRNRRWFLDDRSEIPATLDSKIDQNLRTQGYLELNAQARVAQLNDAQLKRLAERVPTAGHLEPLRRVFAWYLALSDNQRQIVSRDNGLRVADSARRAQAALLPKDAPPDALFSAFGEPYETLRLTIILEVKSDTAETWLDIRRPRGSWVRHRYSQPVAIRSLTQGRNSR